MSTWTIARSNNKIFISNTDMKIGSNEGINKDEVYHQRSCLPATLSNLGRAYSAADERYYTKRL